MSWAGGDWMCGSCQHMNFKKRDACQRCGYTQCGEATTDVMPGDWYCSDTNCGAHNYASRSNCYRCGATKNYYNYELGGIMKGYTSDVNVPPGWKTGDWICTRYGCGVHNYASRLECFKCKTPRDYSGAL